MTDPNTSAETKNTATTATPTAAPKASKPATPAAPKASRPAAPAASPKPTKPATTAAIQAASNKGPAKAAAKPAAKKATTPRVQVDQLDLTNEADQALFAEAISTALDSSGKKTLELCQLLHQAVDVYEGKKKEIRSVLREKLNLTPNQFSRMEDIGAKAELLSSAPSLPKAVLTLKLLVKVSESDPELFGAVKPHLSESTESSAVKHLAEVAKAKDHEKTGMLEGINKVGMKQFLATPYRDADQAGKVVEPLLDSLSSLLKEGINAQFDVEDKDNSAARDEAVNRAYSPDFLKLFMGFMGQLNTGKFIDFASIEEEPGDLERFAAEYLATKKAKLLGKEEARVKKLEKKEAKAQKKAEERAAKAAKEEAEQVVKAEKEETEQVAKAAKVEAKKAAQTAAESGEAKQA